MSLPNEQTAQSPARKTSRGRFAVLAVLAVSLLAGCGYVQPRYNYAREPNPKLLEYVVGVEDRLRIDIWHHKDLATQSTVRPDGKISMPLVGDIKVEGQTPSAIKATVARRLRAFYKDEQFHISVAVVDVRSYKVVVAGKVRSPGVQSSRSYLTVSDAIARAGGPTRFASPEQAFILRTNRVPLGVKPPPPRKIPVDYEAIRMGQKMHQNLVLMAGDKVVIPLAFGKKTLHFPPRASLNAPPG